MKKIVVFLIVIIAIVANVIYIYGNQKANYLEAKKENAKFEIYKEKEITGVELSTAINKAVDNNEQNNVLKDKDGKYIDNECNSINIDIKFIDDNVIYNMEKISQNGVAIFVNYYRDIIFKCINIQYHSKTQKIKYMQFEQITQ